MCLAIPAQVREKTGVNLAVVDVMGVTRTISLDLVPDAGIDDWVLMHAGFAIEIVDEQFAAETLEILRSMPFLEEDTTLTGEEPVPFTGTMISDAPEKAAEEAAAASCGAASDSKTVASTRKA
jgi:hydrogenase expression/formation protein HypC